MLAPMSETPRLYLITPALSDAGAFQRKLEAALDAADVACLLLRTLAADEAGAKAVVRTLAPVVQARGVALLVQGGEGGGARFDTRFVARTEADGIHVAGVGPALEEALDALKPKRIVGVGGLVDRDAAMTAGESGADYLMFGGPDEPGDGDAVAERVAWWAEIFNVPCVGYCRDPADAGAVAEAGAEFVALCDGIWDDPAAALAAVSRDLARSSAGLAEPVR